ncbi:MAG: helix-turn-helix transcriptional regulator [Chlamydiales bacterium]|nr:helix-turn-helix transcriptional regulator [Chlamydiales bacterium]
MSVRTKTRHTSRAVQRKAVRPKKKAERNIGWREVAKENIEKFTETGLAVRGARFKANMTQQQLADAIGAKPHHISEMEHGKRSIGKDMAHRLAEVLDVNYKVFL